MYKNIVKFRRETGGSLAVKFALLLLPLLIFTGAAIDYNMMASTQSKLQQDLDAALLAAIHEDRQADSRKTVNTYLEANSATISNFNYSADSYTRSVSATANQRYEPIIMHLFKSNRMNISVQSEVSAGLSPSQVRIRGLSAHGWFRKLIRLMVSRPDGTEESVSNYEWVPTAIVSGRAVGDLTWDTTGWLDLGEMTATRWVLWKTR